MALDFDAPETVDTGGGNWLKEPGTYHAIVTGQKENPVSKDGVGLDAIEVTLQILAGTVDGQKDRTVDVKFWNPKLNGKDGGLFARQKQARLYIATGLMDESKLGQGVRINLADAVARQVVLTLDHSDEEKKYLELSYANIWHIDDPDAAGFPKCAEHLKLIPADQRRKPDSFNKSNGNGSSKPSQSKQPAEAVDLSDL